MMRYAIAIVPARPRPALQWMYVHAPGGCFRMKSSPFSSCCGVETGERWEMREATAAACMARGACAREAVRVEGSRA